MSDFETLPTGSRKVLSEQDMEIERLKEMVAKGKRVVEDFLPNIGNCALQNYGELNEFMIESEELENAEKN